MQLTVNMHRHLLLDTGINAQPTLRNTTRNSYINDANFDSNMVIILAALLCALLCALGLNSILRCALRCSHRFSTETPEQTAARLAARGLKKRDLCKIPSVIYGSGVNIPVTECPICLGEFEDGQKIRVLPKCNHGFHVKCIDPWLVSHSSCPNCRHSLLDHLTPSKANPGISGAQPSENGSRQQDSVVVVVDQTSN
ncbi:RING-H2 finger protein [Quillaja saponaria]|uniref:RING-type E3 ubiquitin transferase n=1 Tax=Quillaja saponaria TaxID=32244 RepID=A0AAD7L3W3_QUISA|nr:RING-H2 finger protein [Quillaja saponaria]KAJ7950111.1 RING-H2 finger protein [Quillaja saponaria]